MVVEPVIQRTRNAQGGKYLGHLPVSSIGEARLISHQNAWNIYEHLRANGLNGSSAREISKALDVPLSDVYSALKELNNLRLVFILPKKHSSSHERARTVVAETPVWRYAVSDRFLHILEEDSRLKETVVWLSRNLTNVASSLQEIGNGKENCPNCRLDHESVELLFAVILTALYYALRQRLGPGLEVDHLDR